MIRNPFASRSGLDVARDRAEDAVDQLRDVVESVREQTEQVLDDLPESDRGRRPVVAAAIVAGGAAAAALGIRKMLGARTPATDEASPESTPTPFAGPVEPALNDTAPKAGEPGLSRVGTGTD